MAYNRPAALARLLRSLERASVNLSTDLVISIDGGGSNHRQVMALAAEFQWSRGKVEIIEHGHLGLVDHFHFCGDLTERFGSLVLLEDDLIVGPNFHHWATAAIEAASHDRRVSGVCLSSPWFDGYRHLPFEPILDGSAGFYLQIPWFHGMAWSADMWRRYRTWQPREPTVPIHRAFAQLDEDEWFPNAVRYLVDSGSYYLMPREAHATNSGAAGQHFEQDSDFFQVPVQLGPPPAWQFHSLDEAYAVYDDHLEPTATALKKLCPELEDVDLTVDLLAVRDPATITTDRVLTTRPVNRAERSWGMAMRPLPMNLVEGTPGTGISLAATTDLAVGKAAESATRQKLGNYASRGRPPGLRTVARGKTGKIAGAWFDARTS